MRRRDALIAAAAVGTVIAAPRIWDLFDNDLQFEPVTQLPGFRRLSSAALSAPDVALIGVETPSPRQAALREVVARDPCAAAFGGLPAGRTVPVAVFTDYNCPFCGQASAEIAELVAEGAPARIRWHDYPRLGPRSVAAARVAIAAGFQGAYEPVHMHLMRTVLPPGPGPIRRLAESFALDPDRLAADIRSDRVTAELDRSKAAGSVFGLFGTPSIIVGSTIVIGYIRKQSMRELIEIEHEIPLSSRVCAG